MNLNDLSPAALKAAIKGGTRNWSYYANIHEHVRYAELTSSKSRRKCHCGCKRRATHRGCCNGITMTMACELAIQRWIKTGSTKPIVGLNRIKEV